MIEFRCSETMVVWVAWVHKILARVNKMVEVKILVWVKNGFINFYYDFMKFYLWF